MIENIHGKGECAGSVHFFCFQKPFNSSGFQGIYCDVNEFGSFM